MQAVPVRRRFTVAEYERMGETGILRREDRVELIEGEIIQMPPIGSPHSGTANVLIEEFVPRLKGRAIVTVQGPVILGDHSEPQPDLLLLKHRSDRYRTSHPTPSDVLLAVEVSDSTLVFDRDVKARLYADAGIPEYWIVDLRARKIHVHRDPQPALALAVAGERRSGRATRNAKVARAAHYATRRSFGPGDRIAPWAFPDCVLDLGELFA